MRKPVLLLSAAAALAAGAASAEIKLADKVAYERPAEVREAVRKECDLERQMARFLKDAAEDVAGEGKFDARITGVWSAGGPFGAASIRVDGVLKRGGKSYKVASRRNTTRGGGACSKLEVAAKAVAEDLAAWLESPTADAKLGDLKKK